MAFGKYRRYKKKNGNLFKRVYVNKMHTRRTKGLGAPLEFRPTLMYRPLPFVIPDKYTCKLRYAQEFTLDPTSGAGTAVKEFRANDLYDPDCSVGGHQPSGFDQMCLFFNHFTVIGSKIRMTACLGANVTPSYYGVCICPDVGLLTGVDYSFLAEQPYTSPIKQTGLLNMINTKFNGVTRKFSLKKFFNETTTDDDQYQCDIGHSPTEQCIYTCFSCPMNANDPGIVLYNVVIEYIVVCHEPKIIAQS